MIRGSWGIVGSLFLGLSVAGAPLWLNPFETSISSVRVVGELEHVNQAQLEAIVEKQLDAGFFAVDVKAVRAAVASLSWVKEASVRRVWPDSLHISIVEREPVARWGASGLLEADANLFTPKKVPSLAEGLAILEGPEDTQQLMLERYRALEQLFTPLAFTIQRLSLNRRGEWQMEWTNGMTLVLGTMDNEKLLRQFARIAPIVFEARFDEIEQIDFRYANGFAVRWKPRANGMYG